MAFGGSFEALRSAALAAEAARAQQEMARKHAEAFMRTQLKDGCLNFARQDDGTFTLPKAIGDGRN